MAFDLTYQDKIQSSEANINAAITAAVNILDTKPEVNVVIITNGVYTATLTRN